MSVDVEAMRAWLTALDATVVDWRAIHDTDKTRPAIPWRDTLDNSIASIERYQSQGYGIFAVVNELDGKGRELANVIALRTNVLDIDDDDTQWSKWSALQRWEIAPTFYVLTRPGRFHAYWRFQPIANDAEAYRRFDDTERRLVAKFGGDPAVIDPTRVMRVPGTWHLKNPAAPSLVTMYAGSGRQYAPGAIEWALAGVAPLAGGGGRRELDDPGLAAPSLERAVEALSRIDPDTLDRVEWLKVSAAFKAAAWTHTTPDVIELLWQNWCAHYAKNDVGENLKLWGSVRNSSSGWNLLSERAGMKAELMFGHAPSKAHGAHSVSTVATVIAGETGASKFGVFLDAKEQSEFFAGCTYIVADAKVLHASGRLLDQQRFNAVYGGHQFIYSSEGKTTDEAWKEATRGHQFRIPFADHTRFVPTLPQGELIRDGFDRIGVNTYKPAIIKMVEGDVSAFINLLNIILPTEHDTKIYLSFLAHCVQRPGVKALWSPLIQSTEGAGKGVIVEAMRYAIGENYVHEPNAKELTDSGAKFNGWLDGMLLIIANEIRVDDKRDMLEALKPLITEKRLEIQGKGADQIMGDNFANWIMFTNHKDAIPITRDSRRYSIFYSPIQTYEDVKARNMHTDYFPRMFDWLDRGGKQAIAYYLKNYQIEAELDPAKLAHRAPITSSTNEAILQSRTRVEQAIAEAADEGRPGFRDGWLSTAAVSKLLTELKLNANPYVLKRAYASLGYHNLGRAGRAYFQDGGIQPTIYSLNSTFQASGYGRSQGYGE